MRVALIGCGLHAQRVLVPVMQIIGISITAVCDPIEDRRNALAQKTGATPYSDPSELLTSAPFDAIVAAPSATAHSAVLKQVLTTGRPVFIEKPAGWSSQAIKETEELAAVKGVKVQVGFMRRFAPAYRLAKGLASTWTAPVALSERAVCGPVSSDEFFLKDVAVHQIDLARYLAGEVREVEAVRLPADQGSAWQVTLSCDRGVAALLLSHRGSWGNATEHLWMDGPGQAVEVSNVTALKHYRSGRQNPSDDLASKLPTVGVLSLESNLASTGLTHQSTYMQGYIPEFQAFAQTVQLGAPPQVSLSDARAAMEVIERVLAKAACPGEETHDGLN